MIKFRYFECPNCGYSAYTVDKLLKITCRCGKVVETKPIPEVKESKLVRKRA